MKKLYAVLTGDLVGSSSVNYDEKLKALDTGKLQRTALGEKVVLFNAFRGDSFQIALSSPEDGLGAAIIIRARLKSGVWSVHHLDARIAIGIGTVDFLPKTNNRMGDGQAFQNSGRLLDRLQGENRTLGVSTPWKYVNDELLVEMTLLDIIIRGWTSSNAEIVLQRLLTKNQTEIAKKLGISQVAVSKRLSTAKMDAIKVIMERFELLMTRRRGSE